MSWRVLVTGARRAVIASRILSTPVLTSGVTAMRPLPATTQAPVRMLSEWVRPKANQKTPAEMVEEGRLEAVGGHPRFTRRLNWSDMDSDEITGALEHWVRHFGAIQGTSPQSESLLMQLLLQDSLPKEHLLPIARLHKHFARASTSDSEVRAQFIGEHMLRLKMHSQAVKWFGHPVLTGALPGKKQFARLLHALRAEGTPRANELASTLITSLADCKPGLEFLTKKTLSLCPLLALANSNNGVLALNIYDKLVAHDPTYVASPRSLARVAMTLTKTEGDDATAALERTVSLLASAIASNPSSTGLGNVLALGTAYNKLGNHGAVAQALGLANEHPEIFDNVGQSTRTDLGTQLVNTVQPVVDSGDADAIAAVHQVLSAGAWAQQGAIKDAVAIVAGSAAPAEASSGADEASEEGAGDEEGTAGDTSA